MSKEPIRTYYLDQATKIYKTLYPHPARTFSAIIPSKEVTKLTIWSDKAITINDSAVVGDYFETAGEELPTALDQLEKKADVNKTNKVS